jgi:hypothetical protein
MGNLAISGSTSGQIIIQPPAVAGSTTVTIAAKTGTLNAAGPAFFAYLGTNQSLSSGSYTKLQLNTTLFDTNSNFDTTTNYRFTPTVAGYYQVNGIFTPTSGTNAAAVLLYKNGSVYAYGSQTGNGVNNNCSVVSSLVYMNGSTDYIEMYVFVNASSTAASGAANTQFCGIWIRGN